ncbi:hypothetical protein F383_16693 [Gossypium arboreum]|uniref:Uncharacterized protein n=1 Tax=Gossypium arboreum TaxID=29729 RepID=A0A0B0MI92_GOSAR|nr:hypothetical protein F383_16693 [Gossypium arboreum]
MWQIGLANGLFLSTRAETWTSVSVVCDPRLCYMVVCPLVLILNEVSMLHRVSHTGVWLGSVA